MSTPPGTPTAPSQRRRFPTTRWSVVAAAGHGASQQARAALTELCEVYWYPLYAFVRSRGHRPAEAQDLTQEFFARLIEKNVVAAAKRDRGRFRSFLIASLKNFLTNQWRKDQAQKRRPTDHILSLDAHAAERRFTSEPSHTLTPEKIYERRWALTVIERALHAIDKEFREAGKGQLFELLKGHLVPDPDRLAYGEIAQKLDMTEGAVKVALHRLRRRYRACLRAEIADTVGADEDVDAELRSLLDALGQ